MNTPYLQEYTSQYYTLEYINKQVEALRQVFDGVSGVRKECDLTQNSQRTQRRKR
jgi:hypothetical protein